MFGSEQKVFGPPSSVNHVLQNQKRDGGMEGWGMGGWRDGGITHTTTTSAINQAVALLRVKAVLKKIK